MKTLNFVLFINILLFVSCSNDNEEIQKIIVNESEIVPKVIQLQKIVDDNIPLTIENCCFVDSFLVLYNSSDKINCISVFKDNKFVKSFGNIGNGNEDLPLYAKIITEGKCENRFLTIGAYGFYRKYDFSTIYNEIIDYKDYSYPSGINYCDYLLIDNDSLFVISRTSEYQTEFYNKLDSNLKGYNFWTEKITGNSLSDLDYTNNVYISVLSCFNNYIVIGYCNFKMIDIVSSDKKIKKRLYFEKYNQNIKYIGTSGFDFNNDMYFYFNNVIAQKNYFYAVCQDDTENNMNQCSTKTKIYKFDYNGILQKIYLFDKMLCRAIIKDATLYASAVSPNEDVELYYANLD